jgi:hypothetical protein
MLKKGILKQFIDFDLQSDNIAFFISTNAPELLKDYANIRNIHVYDIERLRVNNECSKEHEILPIDPTGIYPGRFPWNLERFIIKEAALNNYDHIISLDSDVRITAPDRNSFLSDMMSSFENNNSIITNQAIFQYKDKSPGEVFELHHKYIEHFKLNYSDDKYNSMDGPVIVYNSVDAKAILEYIDIWNDFTDFGYKRDYGFGYGGVVCGNWSLSLAVSGFELKHKSLPLVPFHDYAARY